MKRPDNDDSTKWSVHGKRDVYRSEWVELWLEDVESPSGHRYDHHVLRFPRESVYGLVLRDEKVLLMWRHRFITGRWGWEVPAGWVDPGETPYSAVVREVEEETGWRTDSPTLLTSYFAQSGMSDMHFHLYLVDDAHFVGDPVDLSDEASELDWVDVSDLPALIEQGDFQDGPALLAVTYFLALRHTQQV